MINDKAQKARVLDNANLVHYDYSGPDALKEANDVFKGYKENGFATTLKGSNGQILKEFRPTRESGRAKFSNTPTGKLYELKRVNPFDLNEYDFDRDAMVELNRRKRAKARAENADRVKTVRNDFGVKTVNPLKGLEKQPIFEGKNGVYGVEWKNGKLYAGGITNAGVRPEYELDYDDDLSPDENLQRLYEKLKIEDDMFGDLEDIELE